jgi:hypothetical protein
MTDRAATFKPQNKGNDHLNTLEYSMESKFESILDFAYFK